MGVGFGASGNYWVGGEVDVVDQVLDDEAGGEAGRGADDGEVLAVGVDGDAVVVEEVEERA